MARVLLLSPFHAGSHRAFAEGLARASCHEVRILSLPGRFWKWRLRGAALVLADQARAGGSFDVVVGTDLLNLAEFRGLSGLAAVPHVAYFHENQLDYPRPAGEPPDPHFGLVNIATALAADTLVFNSRTHRDAFFAALPGLIRLLPDARPARLAARLRSRSRVLPVGCDLKDLQADRPPRGGGAPLILWNHRWEFDKAPEVFFDVLRRLDEAGAPFRLALAGENSQTEPREFLEARRRYGDRIVSFGFLPERGDYVRLLRRADIVVSTARQENFGVAVVEAIAAGAWPLLPRRLSYPEILPAAWHDRCLYADAGDLEGRLAALLRGGLPEPEDRAALALRMRCYDWSALIGTYDDLIDSLARLSGTS